MDWHLHNRQHYDQELSVRNDELTSPGEFSIDWRIERRDSSNVRQIATVPFSDLPTDFLSAFVYSVEPTFLTAQETLNGILGPRVIGS